MNVLTDEVVVEFYKTLDFQYYRFGFDEVPC